MWTGPGGGSIHAVGRVAGRAGSGFCGGERVSGEVRRLSQASRQLPANRLHSSGHWAAASEVPNRISYSSSAAGDATASPRLGATQEATGAATGPPWGGGGAVAPGTNPGILL